MTAARPWRPAMEPKEALWIMRSDWEKSKLFDQNYLSAFVRFLAGGQKTKIQVPATLPLIEGT
jgi:HD-GYP domain-containing protein (c-di-GMP phosphodiesterase class II)